jgi:UDP-3-O-[3-hydroxymyristoyl] glucosamine N-acyltransferase
MELNELTLKNTKFRIIKNNSFKHLAKLNNLNGYNNLVFLSNEDFFCQINEKVSCIITTENLLEKIINNYENIGILVTKNPRELFFKIHEKLIDENFYYNNFISKISIDTDIDKSSFISEKNVVIEKGTKIYPNVTVLQNVKIGKNCIVESGTVLGCPGFEVAKINGGKRVIKHAGFTEIGDNVRIKSNCTITKGLFPTKNTIIKNNVLINNLVQVDHGSVIGERTLIGSSAMISGNSNIGKDVYIGPSAVISNGINIGDGSNISLGAVVTKDVGYNKKVSGNFAIDHDKFIEFIKKIR